MRIGFIAFLVVSSAMLAGKVEAQESWHGAVSGGAIYSTQPSGEIPGGTQPGVPKPAIGGSATGFVGGGEVAVTRVLGVGVEVSTAARFDATQTTGGSFVSQRESRHREFIVSMLLHFHHQVASRVALDVVGGVSYLQEDTLMRTATAAPFSSGQFGQSGPEQSVTRDTFGGTGGFDLGFQVSSHVSVGPTVRGHFASRATLGKDSDVASATLGLSPFVLRFGGNMRVSF
jgi:hypothetical protein